MTVTKLRLSAGKRFICPKCGNEMRFVSGGAVRVVNGKVDMDATLPKQVCDHCKVFYRELLNSGYFDEYPLEEEVAKPIPAKPIAKPNAGTTSAKPIARPNVKPNPAKPIARPNVRPIVKPIPAKKTTPPPPKKRVIATGDIPPTQLKREADGKCPCPRCGDRMDFVEGGPVQIINGRPDFSNTMDHFVCPYCKSVFRKIVGTDYYQWSAK